MSHTDLAARDDARFHRDPIVRSLLDTDFYKLLMLQLVRMRHPDVRVTFELINRSRDVRLADVIAEDELRAELDHARTLRFDRRELAWLAGNSFYGRSEMFSPGFLAWLADMRLPEYELSTHDGQYRLRFSGPWTETTLWEIPALAIVNELRTRTALRDRGRAEREVLYSRAAVRLTEKVERLRRLPDLVLSDFGTRRRHSFLWQRRCVEVLKASLGERFIGTSNVLLAMENDLEAIGTNGHELPMVLAALADGDDALREAPYRVLEEWRDLYSGNLLIVLPDAFGTASFLRDAPDWVADWTGFRPDSLPPIAAGEQVLRWWRERGRDPRDKLLVFSDGMDADSIETTHRHFRGRVRTSFGWGTHLTNDFRGCAPFPASGLDPISLVCKVTEAAGRPAVKLSDNPEKATGDPAEIARYLRVFGADGHTAVPVVV